MSDIAMTNGYPDPEAEIAALQEQLEEAEQQLAWCDKPWDDFIGWRKRVDHLKEQLRIMGSILPGATLLLALAAIGAALPWL